MSTTNPRPAADVAEAVLRAAHIEALVSTPAGTYPITAAASVTAASIAAIEADRAAVRAATVREIAEWMIGHGYPPLAHTIGARFGDGSKGDE